MQGKRTYLSNSKHSIMACAVAGGSLVGGTVRWDGLDGLPDLRALAGGGENGKGLDSKGPFGIHINSRATLSHSSHFDLTESISFSSSRA